MKQSTGGFALIVALSLVVVLAIVLVTYSTLTIGNARTSASSAGSSAGFYAAEAALNARAEQIRQKYRGFLTPTGTSPTPTLPCQGSNLGTGDFACQTATVGGRAVTSYAKADATRSITIPQGEDFEYLNAQETPVTVYGQATGTTGNPEAIASLVFRSRLVPLFQFAVFFDKDLEFTNTATLDMSGPVHTNGNLFLDAGGSATLTINGQTTAAGGVYRGWKHDSRCSGTVRIADDGGILQSIPCTGVRAQQTAAAMRATFGTKLKTLPVLDVPTVADLQPRATAQYWQKADVRIVLKLTSGSSSASTSVWTPKFVRLDGSQISGVTCSALSTAQTYRDNREAQYWEDSAKGNDANRANRRTLDIDVRALLACMQANRTLLGLPSSGIAETSEGGLVIYATVDDTSGSGILSSVLSGGTAGGSVSQGTNANNYAVRLTNAALLKSTVSSDPLPLGVTFVTDEAALIQGDFNTPNTRATGWLPASIIADSANVLSNSWTSNQFCQYTYRSVSYWMSRVQLVTVGGNPVDINTLTSTQVSALSGSAQRATKWVTYNGVMYDSTQLNSTQLAASTSPTYSLPVNMGTTQNWYAYKTSTYTSSSTYAETASGALDGKSQLPLWCRNVVPTSGVGSTVHAAILAGSATTGSEGVLYPNPTVPAQSGGVHNMMRFSEEWGANNNNPNGTADYNYTGSLVSLSVPLHAFGDFNIAAFRFYNPPHRVWSFETQFTDASNLPPLTPRFVYLKQDNFTRQFEQP